MEWIESFWATYSTLILTVGTNVLLALSIYLTLAAGLLTVANAAFMGIGAYTAALLSINLEISFGIAILAGMLFPVVVALAIGRATLKLSGVYLAMDSARRASDVVDASLRDPAREAGLQAAMQSMIVARTKFSCAPVQSAPISAKAENWISAIPAVSPIPAWKGKSARTSAWLGVWYGLALITDIGREQKANFSPISGVVCMP